MALMHTSPITSVEERDDHLVTSGYDGKVLYWGKDIKAEWYWQGPDLVNHAAFSPDCRKIAAACADGITYVLRTSDGRVLDALPKAGDDVNEVVWTESYLATTHDDDDPRICLWDPLSLRFIGDLLGHERGVFSLAPSADDRLLASGGEDGCARVWNTQSRTAELTLMHPSDPEAVAMHPSGHEVVTGCDDALVRVWNVRDGKLLRHDRSAEGGIKVLRFSVDGRRLLAAGYDTYCRVYDYPSLQLRSEFTSPFQWCRSATFWRNEIVVGSFSSQPSRRNIPLGPPTEGINSLHVSRAGSIVGRDDGRVVDIATGRSFARHDSSVNDAKYSPDGRLVASVDHAGLLLVTKRVPTSETTTRSVGTGPLNSVAWIDDGLIATGGYDGVIRIWDKDFNQVLCFSSHESPIKTVVHKDGLLISGSSDQSIGVHTIQGECLRKIRHPEMALINEIAVHPRKALMYSASRDGRVRVWNYESGVLVDELPRIHRKSIKSIACSPEGELVTGSYDSDVVFWRTRPDGSWAHRTMQFHRKPGVSAVAFAGPYIISAGWDGFVVRWDREGNVLSRDVRPTSQK